MYEMIIDSKKLNLEATAVLKTYQSNGLRLHVLACSALYNAAMEGGGNPAVLNRVYQALRSNDKTALRNFIRRLHIAVGLKKDHVPDGLDTEVIKEAAKLGTVFTFDSKDGGRFKVKGDNLENRAAFCELLQGHALNPDGKNWFRFLEMNNFAEMKRFGDDDILKELKRLASKESSETMEVNISPTMRAFLAETAARAEELAAKH